MLYKHPGKHKLHGDFFDYIVVEEENVEDSILEGWSTTTDEAKMSEEDKIKTLEDEIKKSNEKLALLNKKDELTPAEKAKITKAANKAKKLEEDNNEAPSFE